MQAMPDESRPISDNEAHDRLGAALNALGTGTGETVAGHSALKTARRALSLISLGLIKASEQSRSPYPSAAKKPD